MKRKQPPREERRRRLAELNMLEENKRLNVPRRGCASLFGSVLVVAVVGLASWAGLH